MPVCYFRKGSNLYFLPGLKQNCSLSAALLYKACQCFHSKPLLPACYACEEIYVLSDSIWPKQAPLLMLLFLKWFVNKIKQTYCAFRIIPFQLPVKCKPYTFPGTSCQCRPFSKGIFSSFQVLFSVFGCHRKYLRKKQEKKNHGAHAQPLVESALDLCIPSFCFK